MSTSSEPPKASLLSSVTPIRWTQVLELGYAASNDKESPSVVCFHCGQSPEKALQKCSRCKLASYCSKQCQVQDWKQGGHKLHCETFQWLAGPDRSDIPDPTHQAQARDFLFSRLRYYVCPYAVFKYQELGRGFLFVQSTHPLPVMAMAKPQDVTSGRPLATTRSVWIHYLTTGEFDAEVCRDDFELASVRTKLLEAVQAYDPEKELVVLFRFRCGQLALGVASLQPDYQQCQQLGHLQFQNVTAGALELQIDDL